MRSADHPIADKIPISRVRSNTAISKVFNTISTPISKATQAIELACRHRSLASASDPDAKNDIEALLTFSTNARTASRDSDSAAVGIGLAMRNAKLAKKTAKLRLILTSMTWLTAEAITLGLSHHPLVGR